MKEYMSIRQASRYLDVDAEEVKKLVTFGLLDAIKHNNRLYIPLESLDEFEMSKERTDSDFWNGVTRDALDRYKDNWE